MSDRAVLCCAVDQPIINASSVVQGRLMSRPSAPGNAVCLLMVEARRREISPVTLVS